MNTDNIYKLVKKYHGQKTQTTTNNKKTICGGYLIFNYFCLCSSSTSVPWCLTLVPGGLKNVIFFIEIISRVPWISQL